MTVGGPFALTAADGARVTDRTFRGKWLLVYFGYTSCPDSCPTALADIAAALKALGADAIKVQPLFITIDPQRDTPRVVGDYVQSFDPRIVGLSGTSQDIDVAIQAYGAYAEPHATGAASQDGLIDHSVYIYLMNPNGGFVRAFDPRWFGREIAAAIRKAMAQPVGASAAAPHVESQTIGGAGLVVGVSK